MLVRGRTQIELKPLICRTALAVLATALLLGLLPFAGKARARADFRCAEANRSPSQLSLHQLRTSVLCLVNRVRVHHRLPALHYNPELRSSASRHSVDMVLNGYFAHTGSGGSTLSTRVQRAGYLGRFNRFLVGENIGGGAGPRFGSPRSVCRAWMHSPAHRANILAPGFHDFGVGVARGYRHTRMAAAATYTLDFGSRR